MICLIIKTPLAYDQICSSILNLLYHLHKFTLFVILEFFVFLNSAYVELVLRLWLWWLECTCQYRELRISYFIRHLWMREIFVHYDPLYEQSVLQRPAHFSINFNQIKVDVFSIKICDGEDSINRYLGELIMCF